MEKIPTDAEVNEIWKCYDEAQRIYLKARALYVETFETCMAVGEVYLEALKARIKAKGE